MKRRLFTLILGFLSSWRFKPFMSEHFGTQKVDLTARIGVCLMRSYKIYMGPNTQVGQWNVLVVDRLLMRAHNRQHDEFFLRGRDALLFGYKGRLRTATANRNDSRSLPETKSCVPRDGGSRHCSG